MLRRLWELKKVALVSIAYPALYSFEGIALACRQKCWRRRRAVQAGYAISSRRAVVVYCEDVF
jgi:hypothetical protein